MRLDNRTAYDTRDLKKILTRIASQELDPEKSKRVKFRIIYSRKGRRFVENDSYGSGHNGWAYVNGTFSVLRVPKPPTKLDLKAFAMVSAHEMAHLRGLRHGANMNCARYNWRFDYRTFYAWTDEYQVRVKEPVVARPKAKEEVMSGKLDHARKLLAKNEAKLKRAEVLVKKWRTKVKYYEKKVDTSILTKAAQAGTI